MITEIILDSGAYSAWTKGVQIDLDAFIAYIKANRDVFDVVINLDQIPGAPGSTPTGKQVEESAQVGFKNLAYMRDSGLDPMPVFHQGERFRWLDAMIDLGCSYIGISPANDVQVRERSKWLDKVFTHITDRDGWPKVKTHGFGVTSAQLMVRYPWYSCDSVSWTLHAVYGGILVPRRLSNGDYDWASAPKVIFVSDRQKKDDKHYLALPEGEQRAVRDYIERVGYTLEQLADDSYNRAMCAAHYYLDFQEQHTDAPFQFRSPGFF